MESQSRAMQLRKSFASKKAKKACKVETVIFENRGQIKIVN